MDGRDRPASLVMLRALEHLPLMSTQRAANSAFPPSPLWRGKHSEFADAGDVKALAILSKTRSAIEPKLPTALEQGPDVQAYTWDAMFLPKGVPAAIAKKVNNAVVQATNTPALRDRLQKLGVQVVSDDRATPEYLAGFIKSEVEKWAAPIKASGVVIK